MPVLIRLVFALYALTSLGALLAYAWDKLAARRGGRRVRERTLHLLELAGGWPGALLAARLLRHKTHDMPFVAIRRAIVALHVSGWLGLAAWWTASAWRASRG
ncbi:MAG: DUF1294 domain-containing protein [Phycisphaerae bacterium]|nr:DUF1294 domain-containing protein [Phycisphaerae bacterium]